VGGEGVSEQLRILRTLQACGGNQSRAAKVLGVSRSTLIRKLDQYGVPRPRTSKEDEEAERS
jgi:transcriptional regulator of acetoin/glycerol metabolism